MATLNELDNKINELYSIVSGIRLTLAATTSCDVDVIANIFKVISEDLLEIQQALNTLLNGNTDKEGDEGQIEQSIDRINTVAPSPLFDSTSTVDAIDAIARRYADPSQQEGGNIE